MTEILKITVGVRPSARMFRTSSFIGIITDKVLAERGKGILSDEHFKTISKYDDQSSIRLINEDEGNFLQIDPDNIILTKDFYLEENKFNWKKYMKEFVLIWEIVNKILNVSNIRRIGIAGEFRYKQDQKKPSEVLLNQLTKMPSSLHPAKARIKYEDRRQTTEGIAPDIHKSDFLNVIYEIYDGQLDTDHSDSDYLNSMLDIQRYYSPLHNSNVPKEIEKLYKQFTTEKTNFTNHLASNGIATDD